MVDAESIGVNKREREYIKGKSQKEKFNVKSIMVSKREK